MSLRNRKGVWYADITINGQRVVRSSLTTDRKQAQEFHDKLAAELWRVGAMKEKPKHTWEEAVALWLKRKGGKRSIEDDKDKLRWLAPKLKGKALTEIDSRMINVLLAMKEAEGVSGSTVNRFMSLIRSVLNLAQANDLLDVVPSFKGKRRDESSERVVYLTREQAEKLEKELPADIVPMYRFALATGLRQENVVGLTWEQVDIDRKCAWIEADKAKGKRGIAVPLSAKALAVIEQQKGKHKTLVFGDTNRFYVAGRSWKSACVRCGIYTVPTGETYKDGTPKLTTTFRWHDLRHTWATWHVMAGTPLGELQKLGGWKSYNMVLRYAHFSSDHLAQYAENV